VVTDTLDEELTLPAASYARTLYVYVVPAARPESAYVRDEAVVTPIWIAPR
jgi:hypothetical protein